MSGIPPATRGVIYAALRDDGLVKVGFTSKPIEKRLRGLRSAEQVGFRLLGSVPGNLGLEMHLHRALSRFRSEDCRGRETYAPSAAFFAALVKRTGMVVPLRVPEAT